MRVFQLAVSRWMSQCFGHAICEDKQERNHRFLEESLELVQACGATKAECLELVDYVYGRETGVSFQEVGGVLITLAALCNAQNIEMQSAGNEELRRVWQKIDLIRSKQAAKPKHSPLPQSVPVEQSPSEVQTETGRGQ
jgi:NTP pyrophosphatase (non-canonical NTP hydrolase)